MIPPTGGSAADAISRYLFDVSGTEHIPAFDRSGPPMPRPPRLLVVMPSWVGDAVMATPALRLVRRALPGSFIGGLVRPGIDQLLAGLPFFDELHVERAHGVMGPKRVAAAVRPRRYDAALLFTNSFSSALTSRLAGVPRRIGYDRDGRGLLLTDRLTPLRRRDVEPFRRSASNLSEWAPVPACRYYWELTAAMLRAIGEAAPTADRMGPMELAVTADEERAAAAILDRAGLTPDPSTRRRPGFVVLNPGGNDAAKRWPGDRFAALASHLFEKYNLRPVINGSPGEAELVGAIAAACSAESRPIELPKLGITLASLKGIVRLARLMVTNDTGPRHIAAAVGTPVVSLFGPTDHRWTKIPFEHEQLIVADPTLPEEEVSNDHPERCAITKIELDRVIAACKQLLA